MKNGKIAIISLLAMFSVVWWHCYCGSAIERGGDRDALFIGLVIFTPLFYFLLATGIQRRFMFLYNILSGGR